jgi:phenylpropionate dioxygenase-like ring-hydroxylating dioxygenase large terminal subunit
VEDGFISPSYKVRAYPCVERYGYAWVCLEDPLIEIPDIPEVADPEYRLSPRYHQRTAHAYG